MYAEPARDFIVARGGEVRVERARRGSSSSGRVRGGGGARRAHRGAARSSRRCPGSRCARCSPTPPPELAPTIARPSAMDVEADRDSEPLVRPPGHGRAVRRPARAATMQWVFDKRLAFGESASHLSLVSSGATRLIADGPRRADRARGARGRGGAAGRARRHAPARDGGPREAGDVLARRRPAAAPGHPDRRRRLYLAGDWIDTGLPGTIESAVVSGTGPRKGLAE